MPGKTVHVIRKKSRLGHLWVFSNEIRKVEGNPIAGDTVLVYERGKILGSGFYNPKSLIQIRLYSQLNEDFDLDFVQRKISQAYQYRKKVLSQEDDFRLAYGESDSLPGIVIDKYGNHFTLQTFTLGADLRKELLVKSLRELFPVQSIFEKNDFRLRDIESLPRQESLLYGKIDEKIMIHENQAKFYVDIKAGQKTGYFFDHRLTRAKVRTMCQNRKVLDIFCYTGSFTVNAALGDAKEVLGIDGAPAAIDLAKENVNLNQVQASCKFQVGDAFELLSDYVKTGTKFDLIIVDPPPFIKSAKEKEPGMRGYRVINRYAMKLLNDGGILVSSSCSHYLFWEDLLQILTRAAQDAGRSFRIINRIGQGPDHPILLNMPETEYLRCFFLEVY